MTKKHFKALAEAMLACRPEDANGPEFNHSKCEQWAECVKSISHVYCKDNPRFNEERFFDACGLDVGMRCSL